jgi:hypothetical protein
MFAIVIGEPLMACRNCSLTEGRPDPSMADT